MINHAAPIDQSALAVYLAAHLPGFQGPLRLEKFAGGQSNPTYLLTTPARHYVLRKKPPGPLLKSAHAVEREFQVISALRGTGVPVPRSYLLCEDRSIVGTEFFVMDHVDGRVFWDPAVPEVGIEDRTRIYDAMNRALVALHAVDPAAHGLAAFGKPGNYFARQVSRWAQQYRATETGVIAEMDGLISWLETNVPPDDGRVALVHGDYRIDNMIFAHSTPDLMAILDWELSTLGHPLADLAYQCMQWQLPHAGHFRGLGGIDRAALGIPSQEQYIEQYCERAGLSAVDGWTFCLAFSFFRLAAILQGVKRRALDGNASNPERARIIGQEVPVLAHMAAATIARASRT